MHLIQKAYQNPDASGRLYLAHYDSVFRYCVRRLFDSHAAKEVTSTVFFKVMHHLNYFDGGVMGSFISGSMFDEMTVQLWIDENNQFPIQLIATGSSKDGRTSINVVYDNFQWNTEIDPALLKPEILDDFKLSVQGQWETGHAAEEIIDVLRLFVKLGDGTYPDSLKKMTVAQVIVQLLKKKHPPGSPKPDQEILNRYMKVDRIGFNYTILEKDGNKPVYYGDRVSIDTPQTMLFRWKINDNIYRVVFCDLRTEGVSDDKLIQLEALSHIKQK